MTYGSIADLDRLDSHYPLTSRTAQNVPHYFGQRDIRCPLLRPDPAQRQRLLDIRDNLLERIEEAKTSSWLGEVDGLQATLAAADHKLAEMTTLARPRTVHLGLPAIPAGATK